MFEIIVGVGISFLTLSCILLIWKIFGTVKTSPAVMPESGLRTGERTAHSNLSLATIGLSSFFLFPLLLVGVRWSEFGKKIDTNGYLQMLGFLLTGVVSYLYFVRGTRGGSK